MLAVVAFVALFASGLTQSIPAVLSKDVASISASLYNYVAVTKSGQLVQWAPGESDLPSPPAALTKRGAVRAAGVGGAGGVAVTTKNKIVTWGRAAPFTSPSTLTFSKPIRQIEVDFGALILGTDGTLLGIGPCATIPKAVGKKATAVAVLGSTCFALVGKKVITWSGRTSGELKGQFSNLYTGTYVGLWVQYTNGSYAVGDSTQMTVVPGLTDRNIISITTVENGQYYALNKNGQIRSGNIYPMAFSARPVPKNIAGKGITRIVSTLYQTVVLKNGKLLDFY